VLDSENCLTLSLTLRMYAVKVTPMANSAINSYVNSNGEATIGIDNHGHQDV